MTSVYPVDHCGPGRRDPWRKGLLVRRRRTLWPDSFWRDLVDVGKMSPPGSDLSPLLVGMIGDQNELQYGYRYLAFPPARMLPARQ